MKKVILMTGGGTAGHVTPNMALIPRLMEAGFDVHYAGTADGVERRMIEGIEGVTYHAVDSGKLRRYFSWKNFTDPFRVVRGLGQARRLIRELKPDVVFSKGGFVSVPVALASRRVPLVCHESDYSPGLANRIGSRNADIICVTFKDTLAAVGKKGVHTGTPIRPELYKGDRARGLAFLGFTGEKPVLLVMGGSLGAQRVNELVRESLPELLRSYDVAHLCGIGKVDESASFAGYVQYEYISEELPDLFAAADIMISRAGANAIFEILALAKPALLIPLSSASTRGDQELNAAYFKKMGYSMTAEQATLTAKTLTEAVNELYANRLTFTSTMANDPLADGTDEVLAEILRAAEKGGNKCR